MKERWLLPDGVDDLLPAQAEVLQECSHRLMQLCSLWGYQRVYPPLVEFTEALQTDSHSDLDMRTCKLVDQLSGRLLGVRSDFSPSLARIYSRSLRSSSPVRLCYFGELLHAQVSPQGRVPLRVGAELFGCAAVEANMEIICLLESCLEDCEITGRHWVIGHAGIVGELLAGYPASEREILFDALQQKDTETIERHGDEQLLTLCALYGDIGDLGEATQKLGEAKFADMVAEVEQVAKVLKKPDCSVSYDLGEVHGCNYHTGLVFALYVDNLGQPLARGGRYDEMASEYGHQVNATGFDLDLRALLELLPTRNSPLTEQRVYAPLDKDDEQLQQEVQRLRDSGLSVIYSLPDDGGAHAMQCGKELRKQNSTWQVQELNANE